MIHYHVVVTRGNRTVVDFDVKVPEPKRGVALEIKTCDFHSRCLAYETVLKESS